MLAQVVFFLSLALFIVLLARRIRANPKIMERVGHLALGAGQAAQSLSSRFAGRMLDQAKKAKQFRPTIPLLNEKDANQAAQSDHAFWQEVSVEDKPELSGYFEEGDALFKAKKYSEAEQFFLKAATRNPTDARIYARLGLIYLHNKNHNDAIEALKVAVKLDKYNPSRHYNLALAYLGNNDRTRSIAAVREAISLDPVTSKYRQLLEQLLERK